MAAIPLMYSGLKMGLEQLLSPRAKAPMKSPRKRMRFEEDPPEAQEEPTGPPKKRVRLDPGLTGKLQEALSGLNSPKGPKETPDLFSQSKSQSKSASRSPSEHVADPRGDYAQWAEDLIEAIIKQGGDPQMVMSMDIRSWYMIGSTPGAHRSRGQ